MSGREGLMKMMGVLLFCLAGPVFAGQVLDGGKTERVGNLPIPAIEDLLRVDRKIRPSREAMRNSAFVLKTSSHPVTGERYVILTDHTSTGCLAALDRLAMVRKGVVLRVKDLALIHRRPERMEQLRDQLRQSRVRYLAVAPRLESFRENMVLGLWELASTLDDDPQLDLFPGFLVASDEKRFVSLVERSINHRPTRNKALRPVAISQVRTAGELRSLQKAAVLRKLFVRSSISMPIVAIYGARAKNAATLSGTGIWNLRANPGERFLKQFPPSAARALEEASLIVMHGHGAPGMSCGVDVAGLPKSLNGKFVLTGSCFAASPVRSDLPSLRQAPGGYRVEARDAFALRAIDQGATAVFGHMRLSMGFPHLFPVLESWMKGQTLGESYQQLINGLIEIYGFRSGRFVVPADVPSGRRLPQNRLLYVVFGDPALQPFEPLVKRR
ncbi:MAG: hypothetical protein QF363_08215 [Planctomycetaceae bacterium]|nr:hypothetical protein [Planctomycetaceae bacterium]